MKGAVRRAGLDRAARLQRGGRSPALLARFRELADEAYGLEVHVVIVDDGSTDDTTAVALREARSLPVEVVRNETNRGLAETRRHAGPPRASS